MKKQNKSNIKPQLHAPNAKKMPEFEICDNNYIVWKDSKTLITIANQVSSCPKCSFKLQPDDTLIPISNKQKAKVPGLICSKCNILYVRQKSALEKIMRDNIFSKNFTLDGKKLWKATEILMEQKRREKIIKQEKEGRDLLRQIPSSIVAIYIRFDNQARDKYIIVNEEQYINPIHNVFHYSSLEARELFASAYVQEREKIGSLNGKSFRVERCVYTESNLRNLPEIMMPTQLKIRSDGGYASSIKNSFYEIVDVLLYSPFSKRYELLKATHNKIENECFVDVGRFKAFVKKHGNPGLPLEFRVSGRFVCDWNDLNDESILKEWGYSVAQKEGLTTSERRACLSELVDLEILTVAKIVSFLDFFITSHPSERFFDARNKWEADKKFIIKYKANPERFLIAQQYPIWAGEHNELW